jgi:hypothetical protein
MTSMVKQRMFFGEITGIRTAKLSSVMNGCYPENTGNDFQIGLVFHALPLKNMFERRKSFLLKTFERRVSNFSLCFCEWRD